MFALSGLFGWTFARTFGHLFALLFGRWLSLQPSGDEHTYSTIVAALATPSLAPGTNADSLSCAAELIRGFLVSAPLVHAHSLPCPDCPGGRSGGRSGHCPPRGSLPASRRSARHVSPGKGVRG